MNLAKLTNKGWADKLLAQLREKFPENDIRCRFSVAGCYEIDLKDDYTARWGEIRLFVDGVYFGAELKRVDVVPYAEFVSRQIPDGVPKELA